ncbi:lysylphosphatidylglycerol synthase transmembrane domain-containing protein [Paractinoplanes maris]|uniref:lysylphosphatidylglycerol synthase transmembrane domain-containing protein n=1 Tax=Paractinoplanes maris TaxID=1734446 RepID=UPI00202161DA|nr:lysylphosphatidylglycerol synthase transmembrane domain-containing protein [Actinoplanes maris]
MPRISSDLRPTEQQPRGLTAGRSGWWARLRLPIVLVAAVGLAVFGLHGRFPDPREFLRALAGAGFWWLALAVTLQVVSLAAFAWQQRQILRAFGVRLGLRFTMAVTLSRTAISISMPVGSAVSAGYAGKQYLRAGASKEIAAASMIVSGLASIGGLALLYVAGGAVVLTRDPHLLAGPEPLAVIAGLAALTTAAVLAGRRLMRRPTADPGPARSEPDNRVVAFLRRTLASAREAWHAGASLRAREWVVGVLYYAVNWLTDLLCLVATCRALGLPVGITTLAGIYLGVQIVRQVPLTPGGVGVIDTALVAGLTAAGATTATAAAAVVVYRLISCWLLLPAGGAAALWLRREITPEPLRPVPPG